MAQLRCMRAIMLVIMIMFFFNGMAYPKFQGLDSDTEIGAQFEKKQFQKKGDKNGNIVTLVLSEIGAELKKKKSKKKGDKNDNIVTLVVSADGPTKEEATKLALRSAIEQAYGTFVSANTTILNDELVKDEIVTISNGSIKEYTEIASEPMPNGNFYVSLRATVSITNLINYAQSKGAEIEFAGATFGMNLKLKELNKKNELKVVNNVFQLLESSKNLFDYKLNLEEPKLASTGNMVKVSGKISILNTERCKSVLGLFYNTLREISLSVEEREEYKKLNLPMENIKHLSCGECLYFRNNYQWLTFESSHGYNLDKLIKSKIKFAIYDNISNPTKCKIEFYQYYYDKIDDYNYYNNGYLRSLDDTFEIVDRISQFPEEGSEVGSIKICILIPLDDINKYSKFGIEGID